MIALAVFHRTTKRIPKEQTIHPSLPIVFDTHNNMHRADQYRASYNHTSVTKFPYEPLEFLTESTHSNTRKRCNKL